MRARRLRRKAAHHEGRAAGGRSFRGFVDQSMQFTILPWNLQTDLHLHLLACQIVSLDTTPCAPSFTDLPGKMIILYLLQVSITISSVGKESACHVGDPGSIPRSGRSAGERIGYPLQYSWASLMAQLVKNPPTVWETWVQSLGWEDPLEKGMATHSSILGWRIPWTV